MSRAAVHARAVRNLANKYGLTVERTKSGHFKLRHSSGWFVYCASTPSDPHALRNLESDLIRKQRGIYK